MSTPKLGRNARLFKDGTGIGYAKDISVKASAFDGLSFPCDCGVGEAAFHWSAEKLCIDGAEENRILCLEPIEPLA